MRGNKSEKSHIHILESETLSRLSRVTESAQEIVDSTHYDCEHYTNVYHMSTLILCVEGNFTRNGILLGGCLSVKNQRDYQIV